MTPGMERLVSVEKREIFQLELEPAGLAEGEVVVRQVAPAGECLTKPCVTFRVRRDALIKEDVAVVQRTLQIVDDALVKALRPMCIIPWKTTVFWPFESVARGTVTGRSAALSAK